MHVWKHYRQISPAAPRWARRYKKAGVARQVTPWTIVEAEGSLGTREVKMRCEILLLVVAVVGRASACKFYCKNPVSGDYVCCDDGNPFLVLESEEEQEPEVYPPYEYPPSGTGCVYYCAYEGSTYCCADTSVPIPSSHEAHEGRCPEEGEQVCKSQGIFLYTKKAKTGRTSGSLLLANGDAKQQGSCASDGYCAKDEKCCPSKCARRHICLKSLTKEDDDK
ncbi:uncharacterized protein LOC123510623 [Portunus trituberculatus]|uniref:uncharacterized protein LOC123510623 n=1 Tax=Portunus trituberculatus TaxID=210409 RepID=UPI001E1CF25A|nr:uncharacterized protein LOC123510623 [Portunus trituberculatus]